MARDKHSSNNDVHTILESGCFFDGKLIFDTGRVLVHGEFKGEIESKATLIIGESGRVEGTISVGQIIIRGEVHGDISAKEAIILEKPARVTGTLSAPQITMETGVIFDGHCAMSAPISNPISNDTQDTAAKKSTSSSKQAATTH